MIASKIQDGDYGTLDELEDDLNQLTKNAMTFNEPGSQIYRDAKSLSRIIKQKKYELEVNKQARENRGSRNTRRLQGKKHYSADIADLSYEDSESEDSSEEDPNADDPLWQLYYHVKRYETSSGCLLSGPFKTLPSKRELPDYYDVIENPISLNKIQKKLKSGEYGGNVQDLNDDLNLMFENCKLYNRKDSNLYKDGCKLQKICQAKFEELTMEDEEGDDTMGSPKTGVAAASASAMSPARKRMRVMYNAVLNYRNRDGTQLVGLFLEKPSKKDYPDYYEVIASPIDMNTINERIKNGTYRTEEDFLADMRLMFSNCRQYNEEGSDIYEDANVLEKVLVAKARELGAVQPGRRGRRPRSHTKLAEKLKTLFESLRDHKVKRLVTALRVFCWQSIF